MTDYSDVKVKIFGSTRKQRSYDRDSEDAVATTLRETVLPTMDADYMSVSVKVKRKADESPDYLIAYMLRKDTYTADIVKIEVDPDFRVRNVLKNYDDSGEEEDEEGEESTEELGYAAGGDYAIDLVAATPVDNIPTAKAAVNALHDLATNAGLSSKKLLGAAANLANYKGYLTSGVRAFINIGHGYTGGIVLDDGTLTANWFNNVANQGVQPAVVYFNSCQVFNSPLQPAVMQSGARTFIGGIPNLLIGPSEEVCKCFWGRSLERLDGMGSILQRCEQEKYPTQGAHGISGDTDIFWNNHWFASKTVIRTHAKAHSQMAWVLVESGSWVRVRPKAEDGVTNVFGVFCEALANNHKVDLYIQDSQISQATLR